MNRRIHGAPAQALSDALAALSVLAFWVAWTADTDLPPDPAVSASSVRDAARSLRKAARLLEEAADRAEPPSGPTGASRLDPATGSAVPPSRPGEAEPDSVQGGRGPAGEGRTTARPSPRPRRLA